jgi:hypothetical protein
MKGVMLSVGRNSSSRGHRLERSSLAGTLSGRTALPRRCSRSGLADAGWNRRAMRRYRRHFQLAAIERRPAMA